jgi:hypothetical protein
MRRVKMLNKIKKYFAKPEEPVKVEPKKEPKPKKEKILSEKEKATLAGEPYVGIISIEINPDNINDGAFELDWNEKFVINLIRAGYKFKDSDTDKEIVERWFTNTCRNVALELYDQKEADPDYRNMRSIYSKDIGNGRTEVG